jgi:pyruvate/2-oxoglutarate dehydrogenase complex dihydrolipoamide dehydrogenase (E3) component
VEHRFDIVTIGMGAAGLVAATIAQGLGLKVACVEAHRIGGECSWTGCVPSKALLHSADVAWRLRSEPGGGIGAVVGEINSLNTLEWVRKKREELGAHLTPAEMRERGIEVFTGRGRLLSDRRVQVNDDLLRARHVLIATGSSPALPPIAGLDQVDYLTNQSIFELDALPASLGIIGGGAIGIEMAQAFCRLACNVTVYEMADEILPRDDRELAGELREILQSEGVEFILGSRVERVAPQEHGIAVYASDGDAASGHVFDELLVATGRRCNTEGLGLDGAGVRTENGAVVVNKHMRTSVPTIWAAGDVIGDWQFSHMAEVEASSVVRNAVFGFPEAVSYRCAGWATFTEPELASCGRNEQQLEASGDRYEVYRFRFADDDRAQVDERTHGQVKVIADPRSGRIHGAQILGPCAGDLIQEFITAMEAGKSAKEVGRYVHIYPSYSMVSQRAQQMWWADWGQRSFTRRLLKLYTRLRGFTGRD